MDQLILLGGMSRSGANMVGNMLDSHPDIACGPATGFIDEVAYLYLSMLSALQDGRLAPYTTETGIRASLATLIRATYSSYAKRKGKRIVVDRTPNNIWAFPLIAEILPEAKFIHLIRDGRDVVCSQRDVGERIRASGQSLEELQDATLRSVFYGAAVWAETVRFGWDHCGPESSLARDGRSFTTFYENIVLSPESQARHLCEFIGVPFAQEMLSPDRHQHDIIVDGVWTMKESVEGPISMFSAGRWIDHLSLADRILFYARGHVGLRVTGYDGSVEWLFRGMNVPVAQAAEAIEQARKDLLGIAEAAKPSHPQPATSSPARVTVEKIMSSSPIQNSTLGSPLPEIELLVRAARESGQTFMSS